MLAGRACWRNAVTICTGPLLALYQSPTVRAEGSVSASRHRVVSVYGTADERGKQLAQALSNNVEKLAAKRRSVFSEEGNAAWRVLAKRLGPCWRTHAPVSWKEMKGLATSVDEETLLLLGTDFEMQILDLQKGGCYSSGEVVGDEAPMLDRCTAFAVTDANGEQRTLCGQNVDESAIDFLDGSLDLVVCLKSSEGIPDALVFTHPGMPAYCGLNSGGLCALNLFINDYTCPGTGVPIDVAIREVLTYWDIRAAVQWLEEIPQAAATTFILAQGDCLACVEKSATRTVTKWVRGPGEICHSNHPTIDERMQGQCVQFRGVQFSESSVSRLCNIQKSVREAQGNLSVQKAKHILSSCPAACPERAPTIAAVVMEPEGSRGKMHIRFYGEEDWMIVGF